MAGSAAAAAGVTVTDDMEWEEVTHEDEPTAAAQRRRQQQRERSAARRRRMTDSSSDPSSDDSEWRPPTAHSTQNGIGDSKEEDDAATESDSSTPGVAISRTGGRRLPSTVPFPSSSFSSSSNATTNHIPPPAGVTVDAEGNDLEGMDASAVSSSSAAATAAGVISLHTETQLAFADLPGRESNSSGGKLSPAARQACVKLRQQHLTQSVAHASRQISKSKKRKGQPSANGQKRALELERMRRVALQALQQPTHSQSVVATPKPSLAHCKRGVCDIDAFEQRLQSFFRHCGRIHSDKVGRILKGQETSNIPRVVWEAREQRLLTLEKYPERMFKVQLASSNKTYSQHRAAFWLTYAHLAPRGCQPPSQPQADTSDGHESIDEDIHMVDSAITANPAPLPSSTTVTSASASSPSSSSLPPTSMDAIRGNTALTSHSAATSSESSHSDTSPAEAAAILGLCYQDIPLCLKCYSHVYPYVSLSTLTDWVLRLVRGKGYSEASTRSATGEHGNRLRGSSIAHPMTTATNRAIRHLALARGDAAPNSNTTMLVERSYEQLTKRVNVHVQAETGRGVSLSLVRKVMKSEPNIKLSGRVASVPECDQCCDFKLNANPTEMDRHKHEVHLQIQQGERSVADVHCKMAVNNPNENLTLFMDGMDQAKTAVPHLSSQQPKWLDGITPWKVHVTGVMAFGPQKTFAYLNYDHIKSCASLSVHVLDDVLRRLWTYIGNDIAGLPQPEQDSDDVMQPLDPERKEGSHLEDPHHGSSSSSSTPAVAVPPPRTHPRYTRFPEKLYLVMDNSGKDNKNNAVFRYLALLVKRGIFKSIQVNFLLVGHTHDRVDQFFSCISRQLGREDAWTPAELKQQIKAAYSTRRLGAGEEEDERFQGDLTIDPLCRERPSVIFIDQIMDWSLWLVQDGVSVRASGQPSSRRGGAGRGPMDVVGQRLDPSLLPHALEDMEVEEDSVRMSAADVNPTQSQDGSAPQVPVVNTEVRGRAHGLPVFCGNIKNISKPQVFLFAMNLMDEVVVRVQPSSYTLDIKRSAEGKLRFQLQAVEMQAPVVLMSADAPVPYIDPISSPPHPFPCDPLQATYTTMLQQASASFNTRRQREWTTELNRVSAMLALQSKCKQCQELQERIGSCKVATGTKKQRMTEEQLRGNRETDRMRSSLQAELSRHLSSGHQPTLSWTRPWQPYLTQLLDPVQVRIPGRVSEQLSQQDTKYRQSLHQQQREGHVNSLRQFILDSTLSNADRMRFEHALKDQSETALISVVSTKAAKAAAASAAEASPRVNLTEGQDRTIPIQVGDIVAVPIDNFSWVEYPVSIALVVGITPARKVGKKRVRDIVKAKGKTKGRKGMEEGGSQNKRRCSRKGESAAVTSPAAQQEDGEKPQEDEDRDPNGKTELQVVFYYLRYPTYAHACRTLDAKVEHYKRHGDALAIGGCLDKALARFRMKPRPKKASCLSQDSESDSRVHQPPCNPSASLPGQSMQPLHNSASQHGVREGKEEREEDEQKERVEDICTSESSGQDDDAEYQPESEEEEMEDPLLKQRRRLGRRRERQRARLAARHGGQPALSTTLSSYPDVMPLPSQPPTTESSSSMSSTPSSSSQSSPSSSAAAEPLQSHPPLSSHFVWNTGGHHLPATWWKVFTEVNDLFEAAKPDARVLRGLAPWFTVADLERERLGMVLLPPAQRISQLVLQEEVMCWEQASLALTKDGYFTEEFAIKLHHCLEFAHTYNGGYYGNDHDSDAEAQVSPRSHPPAHHRQPVECDEVETKEQLPPPQTSSASVTPQPRMGLHSAANEPAGTVHRLMRDHQQRRSRTDSVTARQQHCPSSSTASSPTIAATSAVGGRQAPTLNMVSFRQSNLLTPPSVRGSSSRAASCAALPLPLLPPHHAPPSSLPVTALRQDGSAARFISVPPSPPLPSSLSSTAPFSSSSISGTPEYRRERTPLSVVDNVSNRTPSSASGMVRPDYPHLSGPPTTRQPAVVSFEALQKKFRAGHGQRFLSPGRLATRPPRTSVPATPPVWSFFSSDEDHESDERATDSEDSEMKAIPAGRADDREGQRARRKRRAEQDMKYVEEKGSERKRRGTAPSATIPVQRFSVEDDGPVMGDIGRREALDQSWKSQQRRLDSNRGEDRSGRQPGSRDPVFHLSPDSVHDGLDSLPLPQSQSLRCPDRLPVESLSAAVSSHRRPLCPSSYPSHRREGGCHTGGGGDGFS
jgi:hypothetical protein